MTVIHLKKTDVVKSSVKGISIEFDHEQCVAILDVPGRTGICEYIKEVWEESRENGIWWIGCGENRRRDDAEAAPEEEAEGEDEGNQVDFDWEAVIDEATVEGESGSGEKFYDAEEEAQGSPEALRRFQRMLHPVRLDEGQGHSGVDPSGPTSEKSTF
ncbi:hypothetical protein Dimus_035838 [Dionaea muscipula]